MVAFAFCNPLRDADQGGCDDFQPPAATQPELEIRWAADSTVSTGPSGGCTGGTRPRSPVCLRWKSVLLWTDGEGNGLDTLTDAQARSLATLLPFGYFVPHQSECEEFGLPRRVAVGDIYSQFAPVSALRPAGSQPWAPPVSVEARRGVTCAETTGALTLAQCAPTSGATSRAPPPTPAPPPDRSSLADQYKNRPLLSGLAAAALLLVCVCVCFRCFRSCARSLRAGGVGLWGSMVKDAQSAAGTVSAPQPPVTYMAGIAPAIVAIWLEGAELARDALGVKKGEE